jgi:hypothetical protein
MNIHSYSVNVGSLLALYNGVRTALALIIPAIQNQFHVIG